MWQELTQKAMTFKMPGELGTQPVLKEAESWGWRGNRPVQAGRG